MKKMFYGLGAIASSTIVIATVVSCGVHNGDVYTISMKDLPSEENAKNNEINSRVYDAFGFLKLHSSMTITIKALFDKGTPKEINVVVPSVDVLLNNTNWWHSTFAKLGITWTYKSSI